jgi:hypothetical protein
LIAKSEIIPLELGACPSFLPTWEILHRERNGASDDALHDRAVAALVPHLLRMLRHSQTDSVSAALSVIEQLLVEGEPDARGAARSLIQTLQNHPCETANVANEIRRLLGIRSAEQWDDFEKYCQANRMIFQWHKSRTGPFPQPDLGSIKDPELRRSLQHTCERLKPK